MKIGEHFSYDCTADCGVPKGSFLDPLLFTMYTFPLSSSSLLLTLSVTFMPKIPRSMSVSLRKLLTRLSQTYKTA